MLALLVLSGLNTSKVCLLDTCFTRSVVVLFQYSQTVCEYIDLKQSNICWKWTCRAGKSLSSAITRPWLPVRFLLIILNLSSKKHFLVNCFQKIPASPERISSKIHPCSMDSPRECTKGGQMRHWKGLPQTHCGSHKSQHSQSGENEKCLQGIVVLQRPT